MGFWPEWGSLGLAVERKGPRLTQLPPEPLAELAECPSVGPPCAEAEEKSPAWYLTESRTPCKWVYSLNPGPEAGTVSRE